MSRNAVLISVQSVALLALLLGACVRGSFDPAQPMPPVDVGGFDAEAGHKNLDAIREILERRHEGTRDETKAERPPAPNQEAVEGERTEPEARPAPEAKIAHTPSAPAVAPLFPSPPKSPQPLPQSSSRSRLDLGIGPMNPYRPPSLDHQALSWSPVPPYTVFTPAASGSPGSIHCVPDSLGGQRCRTAP
jgi:hypothetical protein